MKKNILNIGKIALMSAVLFGMNACDDAEYKAVNNKIYITESLSNPTTTVILDPNTGATATFSISLSGKAEAPVKARLGVSQAALDAYNLTHETDYKMYPGTYTFNQNEIEIGVGESSSSQVEVTFGTLTSEQSSSGDKYALPICVESETADFSTLASVSTFVILVDQVIVTSVPVLNYSNAVTPVNGLRQDYTLNAWSLEFRINMSSYSINNQAIIGMYPSEVYVRFGDAGKDYNMLQVKTQGSQIDSQTRFNPNTWYHIAIVGDAASLKLYVNGVLDTQLALSGSASWTFEKDNLTMIGSGVQYFRANCMLSEFRFWTKAISQAQIQNNVYTINPSTDGLEAYWKMNEGSGNIFADYTGHGNDLQAAGTVTWKDGIRSDGKEE